MKRVWKNRSILNLGMQFESRMEKRLWKVQSRFYPGDLMTRTGDREIRSVSGRLPDNPGELACMEVFPSWWTLASITRQWVYTKFWPGCQLPPTSFK